MKRIFLLFISLTLGFSSCKKDEVSTNKQKYVVIYGNLYLLQPIIQEITVSTGYPRDSIYFDSSKQLFLIKGYYAELLPENYAKIDTLNKSKYVNRQP